MKHNLKLNGRKVVEVSVDGVDPRDYPDFCDTFFSYAEYEDGTPLTDDELCTLGDENGDVLNEMAHESFH